MPGEDPEFTGKNDQESKNDPKSQWIKPRKINIRASRKMSTL